MHSWSFIALVNIDNETIRSELLVIGSQEVVTRQVRHSLRLPYGEIWPEQVYAFAYHETKLYVYVDIIILHFTHLFISYNYAADTAAVWQNIQRYLLNNNMSECNGTSCWVFPSF